MKGRLAFADGLDTPGRLRHATFLAQRELLADHGLSPVLVKVAPPRGLAAMCGLDAIQIRLLGGGANRSVAVGADGIDGSVLVHPVREIEVDEEARLHSEDPGWCR